MIEWLKVNWRPLVRCVAILALWVLVRWFPGLGAERETLLAITEALGLGVGALTAGLRATHRSDDRPGEGPPS